MRGEAAIDMNGVRVDAGGPGQSSCTVKESSTTSDHGMLTNMRELALYPIVIVVVLCNLSSADVVAIWNGTRVQTRSPHL